MPISRSQMPRQMYGLGSFVKSIGKGIKKIVKSPIGKAAILGFGANALIPGGLSSLFSGGGGLTGLFTKAKGLYDGLTGVQKFGGALALAGGAFGGMEDQQIEELKANPEALANYLRQYYSNLNQDATPTQVEEFVQRNMQANGGRIGFNNGGGFSANDLLLLKRFKYDPKEVATHKDGGRDLIKSLKTVGYANGGRIGYADGTEEIVQPSASMMVDTTTSNPIPNDAPQKEISEVAKIMLGPGRSGIGEPEDGTMKGYQFFRTQYLPKKVKEISENYGIEESDVLRLIREEMMNYIDTPKSLEKPKMAYGGRMGYEDGTKPLPTLTELLKRKIPAVKMPDPFKEFLDNMTPEEREKFITIQKNNAKKFYITPKLSEEDKERMKIQSEIRKKQAEEMGLPSTMQLLANGGRINRAYGSDDLVEQASGIEGLDININPKGVKELDLRDSGGFIPPVGVKEKADDIPAMLSNNEFVFTADAVRAAGGGSVNKGAQIMYDTMKKLENGGTV